MEDSQSSPCNLWSRFVASGEGDEIVLDRIPRQSRDIMEIEFSHYIRTVVVDGSYGNIEASCNFLS